MSKLRKKRVLIIGASGYLGYSLARFLRDDFIVSGCYFTHPVYIPDVQLYPISLENIEYLDALVQLQNPDYVIYAAGITDKRQVSDVNKISENLNVIIPVSIAVLCSRLRTKFIFFSCAEIYDGNKGEFQENSIDMNFLDPFGKQKVTAEAYLKTQVHDSTILRLGRVMGLSHHFRPRMFDRMRMALINKESFATNRSESFSFLSKHSFHLAVKAVLQAEFPAHKCRILNVGGTNILERDFVETWVSLVGAEKSLIRTDLEGNRKKYTLKSDLFENIFPGWKAESKRELFQNILREINPGIGEKYCLKQIQAMP